MLLKGTCANTKRGRPTDKARNLKRFGAQWAEFMDESPILFFGKDDAKYVEEVLHWEDPGLDKYHGMADALEV